MRNYQQILRNFKNFNKNNLKNLSETTNTSAKQEVFIKFLLNSKDKKNSFTFLSQRCFKS